MKNLLNRCGLAALSLSVLFGLAGCSSVDSTSSTTDDTKVSDEETSTDTTSEDTSDETSEKEPDSVAVYAYNQASAAHYDVVKRSDAAKVDGVLDESVWENVPELSGSFNFPWDTKEAPLTVFKAYHDDDTFYFSFEVTDGDVLVEEEWKDDESTVDDEDRVEMFFAQGAVDKPGANGMELYYGVEIDPDGRVHDYSIEYYRDFDGTWDLDGLESAGKTTDTGYIVEGSVPLQTLKDLNLLKDNNTMRAGVFRAEFSTPEKEGGDTVMEWISWVDPKTENPDFHVDAAFGEFYFLQ